ncbi:MAG: hypothetical protein FJ029_00605 [Actinobacteria bacterium]|nr:hypothetical protein [Actinomycetota bacterium]
MRLAELTHQDWVALSEIIAHIWVFAAALVLTGLSYMLAHAMIPSLVETGDVPPGIGRLLRMPMYGAVFLGLAGVVAVAVKAILLVTTVMPALYPRLAI